MPQKRSADPELLARAGAYVGALERVAAIHEKHKGACVPLARELSELLTEHLEDLRAPDAASARVVDSDPELRDRMRGAMDAIMGGSRTCAKDPAYVAVTKTLEKARTAGAAP